MNAPVFKNGNSDEIRNELVGTAEFMWRHLTISACNAILPALVALRDNGRIELNEDTIGSRFELGNVIELLDEAAYPELSRDLREPIARYLHALPGFSRDSGRDQSSSTKNSHGFVHYQIERYRERAVEA